MDALTLDVQDEHLVSILQALEREFLSEWLVSVWSEHDIHGLLLTRLQSAMVRPHLESIAFVIALAVSRSGSNRRCVTLSLLREAPVTGDLLIVLKANLDSLASVDADTIKVKCLRVEGQLGDRDVSNEVNRVLGTILDVNGDRVLLLAKLARLASSQYNVEELARVREQVDDLIGLNIESSCLKRILSEVE